MNDYFQIHKNTCTAHIALKLFRFTPIIWIRMKLQVDGYVKAVYDDEKSAMELLS